MKTLLILRHAKSSWKTDGLPDHERPLNARGLKDAPQVGQRLVEHGLLPERVLCSTARRARNTAELVVDACGYTGDLTLLDELYEATAGTYLAALARCAGEAGTVLLVGHNPTCEELLQRLTGQYLPMPTAALAQVRLPLDSWAAAAEARRGELVSLWRPKESA
ncbi:MAG: SixA phosphatase family protein [Chloroflexota bacterium]